MIPISLAWLSAQTENDAMMAQLLGGAVGSVQPKIETTDRKAVEISAPTGLVSWRSWL